jgi:hypothetical protein
MFVSSYTYFNLLLSMMLLNILISVYLYLGFGLVIGLKSVVGLGFTSGVTLYLADSEYNYLKGEHFGQQIIDRTFVRSYPISVSELLVNQKNSESGFGFGFGLGFGFELLFARFLEKPEARLTRIVEQFNNRSLTISKHVENECVNIITTLYKNGVYNSWQSMDHSGPDKNDKSSMFTQFVDSILFLPPFIPIYLMKKVTDYLTSEVSMGEQNEQNSEKLFFFSKMYCLNTFHLQIGVNGNLTMIGDKVDYQMMSHLLNVMLYNIELQMTKNKEAVPMLTSCKQKLRVLKTIVHTMADLVGHSFYTAINKQIHIVNRYTLDSIHEVLEKELLNLQRLSEQLLVTFPEYEQQLLETRAFAQEERRLKQIEHELIMFRQNTMTLQRNFDLNNSQNALQRNIHVFKVITIGYIHLLSETIDLGSFTLRNISKTCIGLLTAIPLGLVEGVGYNLNDVLWSVMNNFFVLAVLAFIVYRIFRKICKNFGL